MTSIRQQPAHALDTHTPANTTAMNTLLAGWRIDEADLKRAVILRMSVIESASAANGTRTSIFRLLFGEVVVPVDGATADQRTRHHVGATKGGYDVRDDPNATVESGDD
jgi:hypothetical protein